MSSRQLEESWDNIKRWLLDNAPGIYESLESPASCEEIQEIEDYYRLHIPPDLKDLYRLHNGQNTTGSSMLNFIYGLEYSSVEDNLHHHENWIAPFIEAMDFPNFEKIDQQIEPTQESPLSFYPILRGHARYSLCVDFKPSHKGTFGQLIFFDTEDMSARRICNSVTDMLVQFSSDLESRLYTVSQGEPSWLQPSSEVDLVNWSANGMDSLYPDGRHP